MTTLDYGTSEGRRPSFGVTTDRYGNTGISVRGFRSRPGAPPATPPQGLSGGLMSNSSWVNTFRNTGPMVQRQALVERAQMPGLPGSQMFKGINQPIIDEFMSQSRSAGAAGMFNNPLSSYAASAMLTNPWTAPFGVASLGGAPAPTATATPYPPAPAPAFGSPEFDWTGTIGQGTKSFSRAGAPQIQSPRYGYAANVAPSFAWNRAFMNG